jgi:hypothetical protein
MRSGSTTLRDMGCPFVASGINLFDYWGGLGCSPNENFKFCIRVYWLDEFWLGIAVPGNHSYRRVEDLIQL